MSALPKSASARLRKTFHYPTDDSSTGTPEVLDEEEQENVIQSLAGENEARNAQFRRLMLALPALSALPYLLYLRLLPAGSVLLPSLLGLSSLASTAWLLYRQDPTETGFPVLDAWARGGGSHRDDDDDDVNSRGGGGGGAFSYTSASSSSVAAAPAAAAGRGRRRRHSSFSLLSAPGTSHRSPLETHLPLLNAGLCAVLVLMGLLMARGDSGQDDGGPPVGRSILAFLPAIVYGVIVAAKTVMASVDPEKELSALRYEHKGA